VLVGVVARGGDTAREEEYLDELEFLALTAGARTEKRFLQKLEYPDPRTYVGSGKLAEIAAYCKAHDVTMVVFDDELSPSQIRNIEKALTIKILDRTNLILDIFARRARTAQAKTQVELAQYQYLMPRLTRLWTHLEKQQGGIGMRGPGEKEIETDRRVIRDKIAKLKEDLKKIDKQSFQQRKARGNIVRVALVGYTNVGKSTIMNLLSKSDVFAENKLFATLDTTVRKVVLKTIPFLLSDTVGFIRKLPHHLVESFKSTLDEVRESDIVLHVVDVSHPNFEEHIQVVNQTLSDIGAGDKPMVYVFNKIDRVTGGWPGDDNPHPDGQYTMNDFRNSWLARSRTPTVFISAVRKENIGELRELLFAEVKKDHMRRYPHYLLDS